MSDVAVAARRLGDGLLPRERTLEVPRRPDVQAALDALAELRPVDAQDEIAIGEVGEMLLRLRDLAGP